MKFGDIEILRSKNHLGDNTQNTTNLANSSVYFSGYDVAQICLFTLKIENNLSVTRLSDFQGGTLQNHRICTGNTGLFPYNKV